MGIARCVIWPEAVQKALDNEADPTANPPKPAPPLHHLSVQLQWPEDGGIAKRRKDVPAAALVLDPNGMYGPEWVVDFAGIPEGPDVQLSVGVFILNDEGGEVNIWMPSYPNADTSKPRTLNLRRGQVVRPFVEVFPG